MFRFDNLLLVSNLESIRINTEWRHIIGIYQKIDYATFKFLDDDQDLVLRTINGSNLNFIVIIRQERAQDLSINNISILSLKIVIDD